MKRKLIERVEKKMDFESGEVLEMSSFEEYYLDKEPEFVKLYLDDIVKLKDLPGTSHSVLLCILRYMNYDNEVTLISHIKDKIAQKVGIARTTVDNVIKKLKKANLLLPVNRGVFLVNPRYFGKGEWKNIKALRVKITYSENGKKFETERFQNDNKNNNIEPYDGF